ncbi:MAG: helix-turn-helix domain-containing protein, partial [Alphaproteobacteria bacterium]|nr:helix-turn-helix domain-containing protein [Alphaproteobacteria bacterium]
MKKQATVKPGIAPAVMTVRELAAYLQVHPSTIYRYLKQGQIPGFRIDRNWRFDINTIDEWRSQIETRLFSQGLS